MKWISAVLIIIGWYVIYRMNSSFQRRNDTRVLVDRAVAGIKAGMEDATEFWMDSKMSKEGARSFVTLMVSKIDIVEVYVRILKKRGFDQGDEFSGRIARFRSKATLDADSREVSKAYAGKAVSINRLAVSMVSDLESFLADMYG